MRGNREPNPRLPAEADRRQLDPRRGAHHNRASARATLAVRDQRSVPMSNLPPKPPRSSGGHGSNPAADDTAVTELLAPLRGDQQPAARTSSGARAVDPDSTTQLLPNPNISPATAQADVSDAASHAPTPANPAGITREVPAATPTEAATSRPTSGQRAKSLASAFGQAPERTALVILVALVVLAVTFIVLIFVGVSSASIIALAVIVTPIASMVAAYYGITLSIQQVKNERAEKQKALERADAAATASRETEIWAGQMEAGLRVAMAKLNAAGVNTDEVTKAAGTPADFF